MSDMSVQGFTVKVFDVIRSCSGDSPVSNKVVNYDVHASVWSTQSLRTSVTDIKFTFVTDGKQVSTATARDVFLDPGQGAPVTLNFKDLGVDPNSLPRTLDLVLTVTANVSAGIISSPLTRSDSLTEDFGSTSC